MIRVKIDGEDSSIRVGGKEVEIVDCADDYLLAECDLRDLAGEITGKFPRELRLQVRSEDGFGTFFFHELLIAYHPDGIALEFVCHTPNKYWEGRFGLANFYQGHRGSSKSPRKLEGGWSRGR